MAWKTEEIPDVKKAIAREFGRRVRLTVEEGDPVEGLLSGMLAHEAIVVGAADDQYVPVDRVLELEILS